MTKYDFFTVLVLCGFYVFVELEKWYDRKHLDEWWKKANPN